MVTHYFVLKRCSYVNCEKKKKNSGIKTIIMIKIIM